MKLTDQLVPGIIYADSKKDYVFDMHIAQKQNAKKLTTMFEELTGYIKQCQRNEFNVVSTDANGEFDADDGLLQVLKYSSTLWIVSTSYNKVFSGILVYDETGAPVTTGWTISFNNLLIDTSTNNSVINIAFSTAPTQTYRIILL